MFYCAITKKLSKSGEKPFRLITERRSREYTDKDGAVIGHGWEVVKEVDVTLEGLGIWCAKHREDTELYATYQKLVRAEELRRLAKIREGQRKEVAQPEATHAKAPTLKTPMHVQTAGLSAL